MRPSALAESKILVQPRVVCCPSVRRRRNEYIWNIYVYIIYIIYLHNIWKVVFLWKEKRILSFLCFSQRTTIPESVCIHIYMNNSKGKKGMKKSSLT